MLLPIPRRRMNLAPCHFPHTSTLPKRPRLSGTRFFNAVNAVDASIPALAVIAWPTLPTQPEPQICILRRPHQHKTAPTAIICTPESKLADQPYTTLLTRPRPQTPASSCPPIWFPFCPNPRRSVRRPRPCTPASRRLGIHQSQHIGLDIGVGVSR